MSSARHIPPSSGASIVTVWGIGVLVRPWVLGRQEGALPADHHAFLLAIAWVPCSPWAQWQPGLSGSVSAQGSQSRFLDT